MPESRTLLRLQQQVEFRDDGCWQWLGRVQSRGYGQMKIDGQEILVHRIAWTLFRGPIPDGMDVHHVCENKRCVNHDHLELVEHGAHRRLHHRKTHCGRGHPFSTENTYVDKAGKRRCQTCIRASRHRWEERQK